MLPLFIKLHTCRYLQIELASRVEAKNEKLLVDEVQAVRDFGSWLQPMGVTLFNAFGNRDGVEAPHSFTFKLRSDLSAREAVQVSRRAGVESHPGDVMCCVKQYMHDLDLQQPPVLVIPTERLGRVQGAAPVAVHPRNEFSADQCRNYLKLATLLETPTYGLANAALRLRELATGVIVGELARLEWLESFSMVAEDPVAIGNPFFGHLPRSTWRLQAKFSRL